MSLSYREMTVDDLPAFFKLRVATRENVVTMEELEEDHGVTPESLAEAMATHVKGWFCEDDELAVCGMARGDLAALQHRSNHPRLWLLSQARLAHDRRTARRR